MFAGFCKQELPDVQKWRVRKNMSEELRWTTVSAWVNESIELFSLLNQGMDTDAVLTGIKRGTVFPDKKEETAKRVWTSFRNRYLRRDPAAVSALAERMGSEVPVQEKKNSLFVYFLEYESLSRLFAEEYVMKRYETTGQRIYTQMDLDRFFELVFGEYGDRLPEPVKKGVSKESLRKVRNLLYKNYEAFGWGKCSDGQFALTPPALSAEWFLFVLKHSFSGKTVPVKELMEAPVFRRFLLGRPGIENQMLAAQQTGLLEIHALGDLAVVEWK